MSEGKDVRRAFEEVLAPDLQAIKEWLAALESRLGVPSNTIGTYERRAEERHNELMASIRHFTDYIMVIQRLTKLEAKLQ